MKMHSKDDHEEKRMGPPNFGGDDLEMNYPKAENKIKNGKETKSGEMNKRGTVKLYMIAMVSCCSLFV